MTDEEVQSCPHIVVAEFIEDAGERARVDELIRHRAEAKRAYDNRHRPAPWIEEWLAAKGGRST
jgi:hypothetical protein